MATDATTTSPTSHQSEAHELANTITHGIGFLLSLLATVVVVSAARTSGTWTLVSGAAYGMTLMLVYALSTLSHAVKEERMRDFFRAWDQGAIYFLIVGTYTPFVAVYLPPPLGGVIAAAIWSAAILGFYSKVIAKHRVNALATWSYLLLGWVPAVFFIGRVPIEVIAGMAAGGVSYTVGVVFLKFDHLYGYFHAVWHVFVIAASAIHFYVIVAMVVPAAQMR